MKIISKIILFDIGGIFVSYDKKMYFEITNEFFRKNSLDFKKVKKADRLWNFKLKNLCVKGKISYNEAIRRYFKILGREDLTEKFITLEKRNAEKWFKLIKGSKKVLEELRKLNLEIVALSDYVKGSDERRKELEILGIKKYFDKIYTSHSIKANKPSKKAFSRIVGKSGFRKVIFVAHDDDEILGAKKLGIVTIGVNNKHADCVVKSIKEIPNIVKKLIT